MEEENVQLRYRLPDRRRASRAVLVVVLPLGFRVLCLLAYWATYYPVANLLLPNGEAQRTGTSTNGMTERVYKPQKQK